MFNLLYHIYPLASQMLARNLIRISQSKSLFDGRLIFTIVDSPGLIAASCIEKWLCKQFDGKQVEFHRVRNTTSESDALLNVLLPLVASNTEQYSFFAHTKGTSRLRCDNENVKQWVDRAVFVSTATHFVLALVGIILVRSFGSIIGAFLYVNGVNQTTHGMLERVGLVVLFLLTKVIVYMV